MGNVRYLAVVLAAAILIGILSFKVFGRDESRQTLDISLLTQKLETIIKNQKDIINRLEDIKKVQDVIRVRASRR